MVGGLHQYGLNLRKGGLTMKKLLYGVLGIIGASGAAHAALTLPSDMSVTSVETLAGLVIAGLAVMWGIRKVIKTVNRS